MDAQTAVLVEITRRAGALAKDYFRSSVLKQWRKKEGSIVTEADHAVQELIEKELREHFPSAAILGEENLLHLPQKQQLITEHELVFAVDPIDGTASFADGLPGWCISIGALHNGKPVAGVVYAPIWDEIYVAPFDGSSATFNGVDISVIRKPKISRDTAIACDSKFMRLFECNFPGKIRSFGSCALHFVLVARGAVAFAQSNRVHLWDIAGAMAVCQRCGVEFRYYSGLPVSPIDLLDGSRASEPIFATHKDAFDELLSYFKLKD